MNSLKIEYLKGIGYQDAIDSISLILNKIERHPLSHTPWTDFPYKPKVEFAIAYGTDCIFLKYYVIEDNIRASNTIVNDPVYEDSCVEFFISMDGRGYYNLEFNCIGTCQAGFGTGREARSLLPEEVISQIKYQALHKNQKNGSISWELTLCIPVSVFIHHQLPSLQGQRYSGNFYKCGDALPEPHFVTWANIQSEVPNFHLPQFFGSLYFVPEK